MALSPQSQQLASRPVGASIAARFATALVLALATGAASVPAALALPQLAVDSASTVTALGSLPPTAASPGAAVVLEAPTISLTTAESAGRVPETPAVTVKAPRVLVQTNTGSASAPPVSLQAPSPTDAVAPARETPHALAGRGTGAASIGGVGRGPAHVQAATGGGGAAQPGSHVAPAAAIVPPQRNPSAPSATVGTQRAAGRPGGAPAAGVVPQHDGRTDRAGARAVVAPASVVDASGTASREGGGSVRWDSSHANERAATVESAAHLPRDPSLSESLLGVGLPDRDLTFLLLIPLVAVALTVVELLVGGRRHRAPAWHLRPPRRMR